MRRPAAVIAVIALALVGVRGDRPADRLLVEDPRDDASPGATTERQSAAERPSTTTTAAATTTSSTSTSGAPPAPSSTPSPAAPTLPASPPAPPPTSAPAPPPLPLPAFGGSIATVTVEDLGASWRAGCPLGPEALRRITVSIVGFDGQPGTGVAVVHADHAANLIEVFRQLYELRYPIELMVPIDQFGGDDNASMDANNTSAFNCRPVTGGSSWSEHSYGWAIDVNPIQNPYVNGSTVLPPAGKAHVDRSPAPGRILAGDAVVQAFASIGWKWGGYWSSLKDYQHFSATGG